jgi:iron complex outermembrane receptor protein
VDTFQLGSNSQAGRPRFKYGVNARYQRPLGPDVGDISVEANWNWQANSGSLDQSAGGLIPSFGLLNMSAAWNDIGGTHLGASLFASNVLDKVYSIGGFGTYTLYGISTNKYGEPRMYGIRLRYRF